MLGSGLCPEGPNSRPCVPWSQELEEATGRRQILLQELQAKQQSDPMLVPN